MAARPQRAVAKVRLRPGTLADLEALVRLEESVFAADRCSRRSFRHYLTSDLAALIVAEAARDVVGYALVLFRRHSGVARLYSLAVAQDRAGQGLGKRLLAEAEAVAASRDCSLMRLEVRERNRRAIRRYERDGYRRFGRHDAYYADGGDALRYEKRLVPALGGLKKPPRYFHQTTEFTCGAACLMMGLAVARPGWRPGPATEYTLWREATTIFMNGGPGGCEPFGLALAAMRHGLRPEIHVNNSGPYFLDTVGTEEKKRVMRATQDDFRRQARRLRIPVRKGESGVVPALQSGSVAIVLVSGYHLVRRAIPHWVFAFGYEGRHVLLHDPAARHDENGPSRVTFAVPAPEFARMTRVGPTHLRAAVVIRKGRS